MDKSRESKFREFLSKSAIDESTIGLFVNQEKDGQPYYPMSVFMKNLWDPVRKRDQDNWMRPAIERLETLSELGDNSGLSEALQRVEKSNTDEKDVATLIHYAQIELLNFIVTMIDGGLSLEQGEDAWGLFEIKDIDKEAAAGRVSKETADQLYEFYGTTHVPTRLISGHMIEYVWNFEPSSNE